MATAAVVIGLVAFGWLTLFQIALAAGAPIGHLAWGGAARVLPTGLRVASGVSVLLALLGLLTVSEAGGVIAPVLPEGWLRPSLWGLSGLFGLSVLTNLFGARGAERLHGVPLALFCAGSCLALALS
ncbi:hypothetical protein [Nioella sp. MMSF_3534]|jgi:hypothetical protein|uniref:hypothetical protein n=1 Tax=Nioella sp. MMSF_3534 TaxID=3046720 RepID=UPI00273E7F27|nr:hypothetical protein [Nioella sp. MMSF_3534]